MLMIYKIHRIDAGLCSRNASVLSCTEWKQRVSQVHYLEHRRQALRTIRSRVRSEPHSSEVRRCGYSGGNEMLE
jgi:hypothetical protein